MRSTDPFRLVHVGALALCLVLMPWSTALLSMAQILLVLNWIAEGIVRKDRGERWSRAFSPAPTLLFLGFLALHVLGLLWTSGAGLQWGLDLVRILLPVLVFAVVLSGSERLSFQEYRFILLAGAWSVIASTFVCLFLRGLSSDYRQLSAFISHIRLSLFLCMSIVVLLYFFSGQLWRKLVHVAAALWAIFFIDLLGSIQGLFILIILGLVFFWRWTADQRRGRKLSLRILSILPLVIATVWLGLELKDRYSATIDTTTLPTHSAGGEAYVHSIDNRQQENGHLVWSHIAWAEVHRTWPLRSDIPLDTLDRKGHLMYPTLFRYLASKGLPKDSVGIMTLSNEDIARVEAGTPNYRYGERSRLHDRFDEVMFELDQYFHEGRVSGHSLTMRLEFWKVGLSIFKEHPWIGVGTGDTQVAFDAAYERLDSKLAEEWRHRAHNQYLTLLISFGITGLLFAMFCLWWPAWKLKAWRDPLFIAWLVIIGIGSLTDDTIETQAGATFFAFYYAFFVLAAPRDLEARTVAAGERRSADRNAVATAVPE